MFRLLLTFRVAFQAGTDDFRTLSAIYSQLGNAYFYMGDYVKAMQVSWTSAVSIWR